MKKACSGSNERNVMSYLRQQHATGATSLSDQCRIRGDWKTKQRKKKGYCISTVIATDCTCRYKKLQNESFTFTERTVIDYIKTLYSYLLALQVWHPSLFGITTYTTSMPLFNSLCKKLAAMLTYRTSFCLLLRIHGV